MMSFYRELAAAQNPYDQKARQRQIEAAGRQIDQLVYQLYEHTDAEITIVEGSQ